MKILKNINYLPILSVSLILLILLTFLLWTKNNTLFCRMSINLYENNLPREMSLQGKLETGEKIFLKEKRLPWLLVQTESIEGWLPEWYVIRNTKDALPDIAPYLMFVKEKTPLYLYPDYPVYRYQPNDELETIKAGVVVKVENEFNNWRYIRFIVHTIPAVQRGWVKSESLTTSQEVTPIQGKILVGTKVYIGDAFKENITNLPTKLCDLNMSVNIEREKGDMAYVISAAGWSAWVNKKDIIFDPFFD